MALLIETSNGYSRTLLRGVRDYVQKHADWSLHLSEQGRGDQPPAWLRHDRWDGLIARIENQRIENAIRRLDRPVVNVSASGFGQDYPTVITHSDAVMKLAADHLIERGFTEFAYCGDGRFLWSRKHGENLRHYLQSTGRACHLYDSRHRDFLSVSREQTKLTRWLRQLAKPVGIVACYDIRGRQVLEACRLAGIRVPDEAAIIGVHNDELVCDMCDPPLSSVIPDAHRSGFEAARLLDNLMHRQPVHPGIHAIQPVGVALRQSTDVVAVSHPHISAAVRHIREHAHQGISIKDVLKEIPMSRTLLERGFRTLIGKLPHQLLMETRMRRARELLLTSDLPIADIARRCGFRSQEYFSAAFSRDAGISPRRFRQK